MAWTLVEEAIALLNWSDILLQKLHSYGEALNFPLSMTYEHDLVGMYNFLGSYVFCRWKLRPYTILILCS